MQRLARLTNWELKKEVTALKKEMDRLSGISESLRLQVEMLDSGIASALTSMQQLARQYIENKASEIQSRLNSGHRKMSELKSEIARLSQLMDQTERLKVQHQLVLTIVKAEVRIKELQALLSQAQRYDQGPIIQEMSELHQVTLRKKEVRDLVPHRYSIAESELQCRLAEEAFNNVCALKKACQEEVQQLDAEMRSCQGELLLLENALVECNIEEYLAAKATHEELVIERAPLQLGQENVVRLFQAKRAEWQEAESLLQKRLKISHPEREAYHDALQELQDTLKHKPASKSELIRDLYLHGHHFLAGVVSSEKLSKAEKTVLLVSANDLVKNPYDEKNIRQFNHAMNTHQEKISISAVVGGIALLSVAVVGLVFSLALAATGLGMPLMLASFAITALVGMLGAGLINNSLISPVASGGQQLLSTARHSRHFAEKYVQSRGVSIDIKADFAQPAKR